MGRNVHCAVLVWAACFVGAAAQAQQIQVQALVSRQQVYVGESFTLEIRVNGTDNVERPELPDLDGGAIAFGSAGPQNSTRISIVNGQREDRVFRGYILNYRVTATRPGTLQIPPITVQAGGETHRTQTIAVDAVQPEETDDAFLNLSLSKTACYAGEPLLLRIVLGVRSDRNVEEYAFTLPILEDERFVFGDPELERDPRKNYVVVGLPGGESVAEKGGVMRNGIGYDTYTISKVMFPKEPGEHAVPPSSVTLGIQGESRRPRSPFDRFFDDPFFSNSEDRGRSVVAASDPLHLAVKPLPIQGRPANFNGLVGHYEVTAEASPTEVRTGDPITVAVHLSGRPFVGHAELPPLDRQPQLTRDFRIPSEMAPAESAGSKKVFRQTIRPMNAEVTAIPPVEVPYFDSDAGVYRIAKSAPIPITVSKARQVTAADIEGMPEAPEKETRDEPVRAAEGIAHNYEDAGLLDRQTRPHEVWRRSPGWWIIAAGPPLGFAVLLIGLALRKHVAGARRDPAATAGKTLNQRVASLRTAAGDDAQFYAHALEAWREYLGARLGAPARSMTHADAAALLADRNVPDAVVSQVEDVFNACEAGHYAGPGAAAADKTALADRMLAVANALEKERAP